MYPNKIIWDIDLYTIFMCVGVFLGILLFGTLADKLKIKSKLQNTALVAGVVCIICAFGSATLFQAFYNIAERGKFEITADTGSTFYGGFIGGVISFVLVYFIAGAFMFKDKYHIWNFPKLLDVAICSIPLAHGFGRIGCLMAGCCHGQPTDAWYGIMMHGDLGYQKYVPIQLFEAIFLFVLAAALIIKTWKFKSFKYNISIYVVGYGIWRFAVEYLRGDVRGETIVSFMSPSQLVALILVALGCGYILLEQIILKKCEEKAAEQAAFDAANAEKSDGSTDDESSNAVDDESDKADGEGINEESGEDE